MYSKIYTDFILSMPVYFLCGINLSISPFPLNQQFIEQVNYQLSYVTEVENKMGLLHF